MSVGELCGLTLLRLLGDLRCEFLDNSSEFFELFSEVLIFLAKDFERVVRGPWDFWWIWRIRARPFSIFIDDVVTAAAAAAVEVNVAVAVDVADIRISRRCVGAGRATGFENKTNFGLGGGRR